MRMKMWIPFGTLIDLAYMDFNIFYSAKMSDSYVSERSESIEIKVFNIFYWQNNKYITGLKKYVFHFFG